MALTAEELLNSASDDTPSLYLARPEADNEPHIVVGSDRFIVVPEELQRIAVQFDHNIETVTFDCPRYWDDHDMSQMIIYINYMRKDGVFGCSAATNVVIDDEDENIMHFKWTITKNVTLVEGKLSFLVCVKKTDDYGVEEKHWNSELCQDCYVSEGMECVESILVDYPDIITQLLTRMKLIEDMITEFAFIDDGKGNVDIQGVGISINFADAYSDEETYAVGDYCVYVGVMHRCNTEILIPEPFNPDHWTQINVADALKECFQFVADGKAEVASAITDMKVPTDATATFGDMAANIRRIKTGQGNAQPINVDQGRTFTNDTGELLTGTSTAAADLVVLRVQYGELEDQYDLVVTQKTTLQNAYDTLKTSYDKVYAEKTSLQSSYNVLQINYNNLSSEKNTLQTNYNNLQSSYTNLQAENKALEAENKELESENAGLTNVQSEYDAYRLAVVEGLANSGLGVTTSTSAADVRAKLLAAFPLVTDIYVFQNGTLSGGASLSGFSNSGGSLYYRIGQSGDENGQPDPLTGQAMIVGLDLTNYNYIDFTARASSNSYWGTLTYCKYGIDSAGTTLFSYEGHKDDDDVVDTYTKTLNVSGYSGVHNFVFECQVHANTTHEGYVSTMDLYLDSVRLYK